MIDPFLMNRLDTCKNKHQGEFKRVLCVCSAGLLRSPTAAMVLAQAPYNFNTRAAGLTKEFALVPVDPVLIEWADEIVCMTAAQEMELRERFLQGSFKKRIVVLNIDDRFEYRNPELIELIKRAYETYLKEKQ